MKRVAGAAAALLFAVIDGAGAAPAVEAIASPLLVLPSSDPPAGTRRRVAPRDVIMTTRLGWERAAKVEQAATIQAAGLTFPLVKDALLIGHGVRSAAETAPGYCTSSIAATALQREGPPDQRGDGKPPRFGFVVRLCLLDLDGDQRFDRSLVANANWAEDATPEPIEPLPYTPLQDEPIPGSEVAIVYGKGALLEGPVIEFRVQRDGRGPQLLSVTLGEPGLQTTSSAARSVRRSTYPYPIAFGDAEVTLLAKYGREIDVEVTRNFTRQPLFFSEIQSPSVIYVPGF